MKVQAIKSQTLWVNVLIIISSVLTMLLADETFKSLLGDNIGYIGTAVGIIGIVLRFSTTKAIGYDNNNAIEEALNQADDEFTKNI